MTNLRTPRIDPGSNKGTDPEGNPADKVIVSGLANNAIRVNATTHPAGYSDTVVLGFRVLNPGTGDLTFIPNKLGAATVVVTAAEITAMGDAPFNDWPMACTSILAGTGMELLVFIP